LLSGKPLWRVAGRKSSQDAASLSIEAAARFRNNAIRLNLADCFQYASARHYDAPVLPTADEFRLTDLETVP
jgi:ribonuclease VapC